MTKQEAKQKILSSSHTDKLEPKAIMFILDIIDEIEYEEEYEIKESDILVKLDG